MHFPSSYFTLTLLKGNDPVNKLLLAELVKQKLIMLCIETLIMIASVI